MPAPAGARRRAATPPREPGSDEFREAAREAALRLLAARDRSAADLRGRLLRKGFDQATVEQALRSLREAGLQDDERFARDFAEEAARRRGLAPGPIRRELRRLGVAADLAEAAAPASPEVEEERALALARSRAARLSGLSPEARERRLLGLLARRGFDLEVSVRAVRMACVDEAGRPGSDPED